MVQCLYHTTWLNTQTYTYKAQVTNYLLIGVQGIFIYAAECFFRDNLSRHYFVSTKTIFFETTIQKLYFLKPQSANRIFFFNQICQQNF